MQSLCKLQKNSRGVGILIKKSLDCAVLEERRDRNNNTLALLTRIQGELILLVSIYGPNKICEDFFVDLERILINYKNVPIIIGGDWNLTPSPLPANLNPDALNMIKIPNEKHTRNLQSLQIKYLLVDAFRILYPNRKDYSYIPRDCTKNNRSRIDFF
jgi:exonuclease III